MPPTITLRITDNADRPLASMEVPVPLSGEPGECAMFDADLTKSVRCCHNMQWQKCRKTQLTWLGFRVSAHIAWAESTPPAASKAPVPVSPPRLAYGRGLTGRAGIA